MKAARLQNLAWQSSAANGGIGRGGEIRTRDHLHPMQVRYQAALRPESGYFNPCSCSRTARSSRLIAARSTPAPATGGSLRTGSGLSSWVSELSRRVGAPPFVEAFFEGSSPGRAVWHALVLVVKRAV